MLYSINLVGDTMTFHNKFLSFTLAVGMISSTLTLAANPYQGCKGTEVMKSKGKSNDISKELESSHQRVQKICKELDGKVKKVNTQAMQCINGSGEGEKAQDLLSQLTDNVKNACDKMKANLKTAQNYCADRNAALKELEAKIKGASTLSTGPGQQAVEAQSAAFTKQKGIYTDSKATFTGLAAKSEAAANEIYDTLPDRDEAKRNQRGVAAENEDTKDPKLDALVTNLQSRFQRMAQDKNNKNAKACQKIASKNGDLGDISETLKNNLWPNGKKSARAISSMSTSDKIRALDYDGLAAQAGSKATNLGAAPDAADPALAGGSAAGNGSATDNGNDDQGISQELKRQQEQNEILGGPGSKSRAETESRVKWANEHPGEEYNPNGVEEPSGAQSAVRDALVAAGSNGDGSGNGSANGSGNDGTGGGGYTPPVVNRGPTSEVSPSPSSPSVSQLGGGQCCYSYSCSLNPWGSYDGLYDQSGQCVPK